MDRAWALAGESRRNERQPPEETPPVGCALAALVLTGTLLVALGKCSREASLMESKQETPAESYPEQIAQPLTVDRPEASPAKRE